MLVLPEDLVVRFVAVVALQAHAGGRSRGWRTPSGDRRSSIRECQAAPGHTGRGCSRRRAWPIAIRPRSSGPSCSVPRSVPWPASRLRPRITNTRDGASMTDISSATAQVTGLAELVVGLFLADEDGGLPGGELRHLIHVVDEGIPVNVSQSGSLNLAGVPQCSCGPFGSHTRVLRYACSAPIFLITARPSERIPGSGFRRRENDVPDRYSSVARRRSRTEWAAKAEPGGGWRRAAARSAAALTSASRAPARRPIAARTMRTMGRPDRWPGRASGTLMARASRLAILIRVFCLVEQRGQHILGLLAGPRESRRPGREMAG
jgi:hypothetical protein